MDFVSIAHAMGAATGGDGGAGGNPIGAFLPLILMFVIFYFLLIRPQQKKAKEHKKMLAALQRGDHVLTNGGMYGRITAIENDVLTVGTRAEFRSSREPGLCLGLGRRSLQGGEEGQERLMPSGNFG